MFMIKGLYKMPKSISVIFSLLSVTKAKDVIFNSNNLPVLANQICSWKNFVAMRKFSLLFQKKLSFISYYRSGMPQLF